MPAAAVTPAPLVYTDIVAIKTLVVDSNGLLSRSASWRFVLRRCAPVGRPFQAMIKPCS